MFSERMTFLCRRRCNDWEQKIIKHEKIDNSSIYKYIMRKENNGETMVVLETNKYDGGLK